MPFDHHSTNSTILEKPLRYTTHSTILEKPLRYSTNIIVPRRTATTNPSEVLPAPRKSDNSKSRAALHRTTAPYVLSTSGQLRGRCASRCSSHLGWEHFCQYGGPMYDREVRPGNSRRKVRNKGGTTTRRPSLALLGPLLMNFRARVSHHHSPCRAAVRTYLQGGNGVDVQGDSTGVYPAHCRDQRTRVTRGKWHGYTPPGLRSCRTWSAPSQDGAQWGACVEVQRWRS